MKPYYSHAGVTIYHGDCRDILSELVADVLITDPPFGVTLGVGKDMRGGKHGLAKRAYGLYEDTQENLIRVVVPAVTEALAMVKRGAVFCAGSYVQVMPPASALGGVYCPAATGRHCWGFNSILPVLFYGKDPELHRRTRPTVLRSNACAEPSPHPCPKPLPWMEWMVERVSLTGETVLDPFAGSGTTLVAAKDHGRRAIGIEIEERYCELAANRLSQEVLELAL